LLGYEGKEGELKLIAHKSLKWFQQHVNTIVEIRLFGHKHKYESLRHTYCYAFFSL